MQLPREKKPQQHHHSNFNPQPERDPDCSAKKARKEKLQVNRWTRGLTVIMATAAAS